MTSGADLRLLPAAAAAWLAAGWAVGAAPPAVLTAAAACLLVALGLLLRGRGGQAGLALVAAALGMMSAAGQLAVQGAGVLPDLTERQASIRADAVVRADPRRVREQPEARPEDEPRYVVRLALQRVTGRGVTGAAHAQVLAIGDRRWADLRPGQRLQVRGRLAPAEPGDDVVALLLVGSGPGPVTPAGGLQRRAEALRVGLRTAAEPLAPDSRGLLPGLVVGDTSQLPPDLDEAMRRVGLTHLTAVSGSNVAIVCGTVLLVAAACGAGRRLRLGLAASGLVGFVVLARPDPSVLRAAVMGAIGLLGLASARRARGMPALSAAVVVLTVVDPWLARAFGFALSVLATAGLLLLARPWARELGRVLPRPLAQAVAVPAAAQAVCAPVIVLLAPQLSLAAVPANLLVAPAVAPATVLGVVATLVAPWWAGGATAVAWVAGWSTWWIAKVARVSSALPGAAVPWPGGASGALLLAGITLLAVLALPVLARAVSGAMTRARTSRVTLAVLAVVTLVVAALLAPGSPLRVWPAGSWPPPGWRVVACDVGQGDAMAIRTGPTSAIVIDTGPDPRLVDACLTRLAVTTVDLLVITHFHADHVGGLAGVLRGRRVVAALVSPLDQPAEQARAAAEALAASGVPVSRGTTGVSGTGVSGASGPGGSLQWRVLWPAADGGVAAADGPPREEDSAPNDASVVVLVEAPGLRLLATGDIEPAAQVPLRQSLDDLGVSLPIDVLKVAHHGSARQDAVLHKVLAPRLALISSGAGNDYGHPARPALDLLAEVGAMVARTDRLGDVAVGGDANRSGQAGLWVAGRRSSASATATAGAMATVSGSIPIGHRQRDVARFTGGYRTLDPQHVARRRGRAGGAGDRNRVAARRPGDRADPGAGARPGGGAGSGKARGPPGARAGQRRRLRVPGR